MPERYARVRRVQCLSPGSRSLLRGLLVIATTVVFRKFRSNGEIIALFPQLPGTMSLATCSSYLRVGQHGSASVDLAHCTALAAPAEYASLAAELRGLGYVLDIRARFTRADQEARRIALNR